MADPAAPLATVAPVAAPAPADPTPVQSSIKTLWAALMVRAPYGLMGLVAGYFVKSFGIL